jgi:hypothetical protein
MPRHFSRKRKTRYGRSLKNGKKTRRNKKGGLLFDQSLNIGGIDLSRQTGQKRYNWKTGKWDNMVCYGVGPLKGCKIVPAK